MAGDGNHVTTALGAQPETFEDDGLRPEGEAIVRRRLSHNELEMARQYSETSARISAAIEVKDKKAGPADLKAELEMWEHKVTVAELCKKLDTDPASGLTSSDAAARLERDGPNMLSPPKVTPWWIKLGAQFLNFFSLLLQAASILCFVGYALAPEVGFLSSEACLGALLLVSRLVSTRRKNLTDTRHLPYFS